MRRSSRALAFEQTFYPMTLITRQPLGNLRARCLQNRRQLPAGAPLRIQHYRLQPLGHAIGSIPFRLFAQSNQPLIGARTQMNHSGKHGTPPTGSMPCFYLNVPLFMRACIAVAFQDELGLMRTRHRWPSTVREVAAVAAGVRAFSTELGQTADGVLGPSQWEPGMTF